ncbi:MAG: hypothetical protein NC822_02065 [Candidatus Omnitrophica bacterium]|nr:hypothetical protein [Candidatus Omnitrophota bacterium]MCM8826467.1 hypothetical protein [Candidatus Omnitrophota bacterium]
MPLQIKDIVSKDLNSHTDINQQILKLQKYFSSQDLAVVIHINRNIRLVIPEIKIPELKISELWFIGAMTSDLSKWFIAGNFMNKAKIFKFDYPVNL